MKIPRIYGVYKLSMSLQYNLGVLICRILPSESSGLIRVLHIQGKTEAIGCPEKGIGDNGRFVNHRKSWGHWYYLA